MTDTPSYSPLKAALPATVPFVCAEELERQRGAAFAARVGANERSVFGPSPHVLDAMRDAADTVWMYGDGEAHDLRSAIARRLGVGVENIVIGEGIDGLLGTLVRLLIDEGDPVVTSSGGYPTFAYHVRAEGGHLHEVPYRDDHEDLDALLAKAKSTGAKILYLANPDNPMGSWHGAGALQNLIDALPNGCLLLLDEAYIEFAPEGTAPPLDMQDRRLIRMRTFSKAYGLAGMRVGYGLAHPGLIASFDKIRNHFGVGRLSQVAALAALDDIDWLAHVMKQVDAARERLAQIATGEGLKSLPTATNFTTIDCGRDGDFARAVLQGIQEREVFVRMPGVAPLDRCIRVSHAPSADLDLFAGALRDTLKSLR